MQINEIWKYTRPIYIVIDLIMTSSFVSAYTIFIKNAIIINEFEQAVSRSEHACKCERSLTARRNK
jgi:hypothetical protein